MRDLWKALTLLSVDKDLCDEIKVLVKFNHRPTLAEGLEKRKDLEDLHFENQPNIEALIAMQDVFREKGLLLAAYDLAEINRWMMNGGADFLAALDDLKVALDKTIIISDDNFAALEAVGVLVSDSGFLDAFQKGDKTLRSQGFTVTEDEEDQLRVAFVVGGSVEDAAKKIIGFGWSGSSCASRYVPYDGMFHFNM